MPNFKTSYESRKWNQLERLADDAFRVLKSGNANIKDLDNARQVVAEFGSALVDVLNDSVSEMHRLAEERVARIDKHRSDLGKSELDLEVRDQLLELALTKVVQGESIELAVTLESLVKDQLATQNSYLSDLMDQKFLQYLQEKPEQDNSLLEGFNSLDRYIRQKLSDITSSGKSEPTESTVETAVASLLNYHENIEPLTEANTETSVDRVTRTSVPSLDKNETDLAAMITVLQDQLSAINDELDYDRMRSLKKKEEEDKANTWLRKLGRGVKRVAKKATGIGLMGSLALVLGRMLIASLTGSEVWKPIWDKLSSIVSFDRIKEVGGDFLDWILDSAKSFFVWVKTKVTELTKAWVPDVVRNWIDKEKPQVEVSNNDLKFLQEEEQKARSSGKTEEANQIRELIKEHEIENEKARAKNAEQESSVSTVTSHSIPEPALARGEESKNETSVPGTSASVVKPSFNSATQHVTNNSNAPTVNNVNSAVTSPVTNFDVSPEVTLDPIKKFDEETRKRATSTNTFSASMANSPMGMPYTTYQNTDQALLNLASFA